MKTIKTIFDTVNVAAERSSAKISKAEFIPLFAGLCGYRKKVPVPFLPVPFLKGVIARVPHKSGVNSAKNLGFVSRR